MAIFPCTYFTYATRYPESGARIQFGNSYTFAAGPTAPDQRIFTLTLPGMQYFVDQNGDIDLITEGNRNMAVLESFYNTHKLHLVFDFNHPVHGLIQCRFNRPLEVPEGIPGGNGVLEDVTVELIEIP
jgi:hypothetical protein